MAPGMAEAESLPLLANGIYILFHTLGPVHFWKVYCFFKYTSIDEEIIIKAFKSIKLEKTEDLWGVSAQSISPIIKIFI